MRKTRAAAVARPTALATFGPRQDARGPSPASRRRRTSSCSSAVGEQSTTLRCATPTGGTLLKALTLDEGRESDHHENFSSSKSRRRRPEDHHGPGARKAYLQTGHKQRAIIEAQRQAQLGEALEGQAQLDAASAREEADFEPRWARHRPQGGARAADGGGARGHGDRGQEALEGPGGTALSSSASRHVRAGHGDVAAERRMRGSSGPARAPTRTAIRCRSGRPSRGSAAAPLHYTRTAIRRDDDTWLRLRDQPAGRGRAAGGAAGLGRERAGGGGETTEGPGRVTQALPMRWTCTRGTRGGRGGAEGPDAEDERSAEEDRPGSAWSQSSEISGTARARRGGARVAVVVAVAEEGVAQERGARQRRTHEPDAKPGSRATSAKSWRGAVRPKESTEMSPGRRGRRRPEELTSTRRAGSSRRGAMTSVATCRAPTCCATGRGPRRAGAGPPRGSAAALGAKQKPKKKKGGAASSRGCRRRARGRGRRGAPRQDRARSAGVAAVAEKEEEEGAHDWELRRKGTSATKAERRRGKGRLRKIRVDRPGSRLYPR